MASVRREAGEDGTASLSPRALKTLLARSGEDFVRQAYWQILGRDVDPAGLAGYVPRSNSLPGRMIIVAALLLSPERLILPPWLRRILRALGRPFHARQVSKKRH